MDHNSDSQQSMCSETLGRPAEPTTWAEYQQTEYVDDYRVTRKDLDVLIRHYLDELFDIEFICVFHGYGLNSSWDHALRYAHWRLEDAENALGSDQFEAIADPHNKQLRKSWLKAKKELVCRQCGVPQDYLDELEEGMCEACRKEYEAFCDTRRRELRESWCKPKMRLVCGECDVPQDCLDEQEYGSCRALRQELA